MRRCHSKAKKHMSTLSDDLTDLVIRHFGDNPESREAARDLVSYLEMALVPMEKVEERPITTSMDHSMIPVEPGAEIAWITGKLTSRISDVKRLGNLDDQERDDQPDNNGRGDGTDGDDGTLRESS
jgi:hypothetical protein